jgi:hypothetical protein
LINFRLAIFDKLLIKDDNESILQRIDDYQLIINALNSQEKDWTNETTEKLIHKLETMVNIFLIKIFIIILFYRKIQKILLKIYKND